MPRVSCMSSEDRHRRLQAGRTPATRREKARPHTAEVAAPLVGASSARAWLAWFVSHSDRCRDPHSMRAASRYGAKLKNLLNLPGGAHVKGQYGQDRFGIESDP